MQWHRLEQAEKLCPLAGCCLTGNRISTKALEIRLVNKANRFMESCTEAVKRELGTEMVENTRRSSNPPWNLNT